MTDDKIDLHWRKFSAQLAAGVFALACSVFASERILTATPNGSATVAAYIGGALILLPFYMGAVLLRVPYRTDEFERRLRNWSMTQAGIIVLIAAVTANLAANSATPGQTFISPYIMPALFLICHTLYSQYLRHRVAHGRPNAFTGKGTC